MEANPKLYFWRNMAAYQATSLQSSMHAHHAVQITIGATPIRVSFEGHEVEEQIIVIPADVSHEMNVSGQQFINIYIDPDQATARALIAQDRLPSFDKEHITTLFTSKSGDEAHQSIMQLLKAITNKIENKVDDRIQIVLDRIAASEVANISTGMCADWSHLSESRFMHVFKEQVGLPLKSYLLWHKLRLAIRHLLTSGNVSEAAHAGGFADASHMGRTFRSMFGGAPTDFLGPQASVEVIVCD